MNDASQSETQAASQELAGLRFLRRLVTTLTAVMILGLLTIVGLFVIRLGAAPQDGASAIMQLPENVSLPEGHAAQAFTQGDGWFAVVSDQNEIFIFNSENGALRQRITISN